MRQRNILYLTSVLVTEGAQHVLLTLAGQLNTEQYKALICCLTPRMEMLPRFQQAGIEVVPLGMQSYSVLSILRAVHDLRALIHIRQIDLIHTTNFSDGLLGRVVARLTGVPVVLSSIHAFYRSKPRLELLLDMVTARLADGVIVVSEAVRQFAIADLKIPDNKIDVVYNGITSLPVVVDVESIRRIRAEIGLRSDSSVVACVGSLKEVKGHKYLLQAMPLILRDVPNVQFLIIGDGPLQPELRSLATALGIADKVCFAGLREDVRTILPAIDILVQPSLQETFSLAILEAMAAEKTVVATKVGGIPELVEDGRTGLLVPPENPSAIAKAVISLLSSPYKRRMFGVAGGKRFREFFTAEKMVRRYKEIYEFCLERKGVL